MLVLLRTTCTRTLELCVLLFIQTISNIGYTPHWTQRFERIEADIRGLGVQLSKIVHMLEHGSALVSGGHGDDMGDHASNAALRRREAGGGTDRS